ncbi:hypothetical protein [Acetobacterium bakii]|uniref:hypothetical protein n=1 Tax=Acetobacterium bakii TaxID=52689 RepID=UPI001364BA20|nr:hypothetical protein [Acetobacterium bakii]
MAQFFDRKELLPKTVRFTIFSEFQFERRTKMNENNLIENTELKSLPNIGKEMDND